MGALLSPASSLVRIRVSAGSPLTFAAPKLLVAPAVFRFILRQRSARGSFNSASNVVVLLLVAALCAFCAFSRPTSFPKHSARALHNQCKRDVHFASGE